MKNKDLIKAIYEALPEENKENPVLETYDSLTVEQKKEVDELSKGPLELMEKEDLIEDLKEYKMNFKTNIFSNLFKYKASDLNSPIENFTTESLVFLLRLSIDSDKIFFKEFLSLIDKKININEDDVIHIETQKRFNTKSNNKVSIAIPDITIIINTLYLFIEVKVGSSLNEENINDLEIKEAVNQLNKYYNIVFEPNNVKKIKICTLTIFKEKTEVGFSYDAITWNQIAVLIDNYKALDKTYERLMLEFSKFIKSNNMAADKVERTINEAVPQLTKLLFQIKLGLDKLGNDYKIKLSTAETYSGYYIESKDRFKLWIGFEFKNQTIKIQIVNKELIDFVKNKKYIIDPNSKKYILVSELLDECNDYFELEADKQFDKISKWLETNISELQRFIEDSNKPFKLDF